MDYSIHLCATSKNPDNMSLLELRERSLEKNVEAPVKVAIASGDGIGPEIMAATLRILDAAGANLEPEFIDLGEKVYLSGNSSGIDSDAWKAIRQSQVIFKAPITTAYRQLPAIPIDPLLNFLNLSCWHKFVK